MGLTKQYLRYVPAALFGITASTKCNIVFLDFHGTVGKMCAVGACQSVIIWDLRKGEKVSFFNSSLEFLCFLFLLEKCTVKV